MNVVPIRIDSIHNSQFKDLLKLQKNQTKPFVDKFVIDGEHFCQLANQENKLVSLWVTEKAYKKILWIPKLKVKIYLISENIAQRISRVQHSWGIIGVCKKPETQLMANQNVLIIDDLQDPGNLGTLLRSAAAFNFLNIIASPNAVSFYNDKVLRATQGLIFKLNLITVDLGSFLPTLKAKNYAIIGTFLQKKSETLVDKKTKNQLRALLIGNEGQGLKPEWLKFIDYNFIVPINPAVESLNAAVAGSIVMYQLNQH